MSDIAVLQNTVGDMIKKMGHSDDPHIILLFLLEELGEAARAFLKENGYKEQNNRVTESFKEELGDVFLLLLRLAYVTHTDLERQLATTEKKLLGKKEGI
jgi:NTP pyrophosphatase (non-canonical NTP hydrolase)